MFATTEHRCTLAHYSDPSSDHKYEDRKLETQFSNSVKPLCDAVPWAAAPSMEDATVLVVTPARKLADAEAADGTDTGPVTLVRTAGLNVHLEGIKSALWH